METIATPNQTQETAMTCTQTNFASNEVGDQTLLALNPLTKKAFVTKDHFIAAALVGVGIAVMIALCGGNFFASIQTPEIAAVGATPDLISANE